MTVRVLLLAVLAATVASAQQPPQPFGKGAYRFDEPGLVKPKLVKQVSPDYPSVAKNASVAGDVEIEAVVLPDGRVGDTRIVKSLDKRFGLDEEALRVAKLWLFEPGRKDGFPVPVLVTIVVQFRLRADPTRGPVPIQVVGTPSGRFTTSTARPTQDPDAPSEPDDEFVKGAYRDRDPGVKAPTVKKNVPPRAPLVPGEKPNGVVYLDAIVMPDGKIGKIRVAKSLDKLLKLDGFDAAAIDAARQWVFEPGTKDGVPAPIVVRLMIEFRTY